MSLMVLTVELLSICCIFPVQAEEPKESELYAKSCVLMDAKTGRVLYGKNETEVLPMASTTKILTCIIALEQGKLDDIVTATTYAASQPKVHLGMVSGRQYRLEDLLYSLMLESHNDSAVAIAEHIGGSVEGFAVLMNEKAAAIGCHHSFFITPNGLDASVTLENGEVRQHATTAVDLARIMSYCILESPQKEEYLRITQTMNYSFSDVEGKVSYSCYNHNAFLSMMEGAISGKTGFTGGAGYCYVGAVRQGERYYTIALLACGWPGNKTYKWSDAKKLFQYGIQAYEERRFYEEKAWEPLPVKWGTARSGNPYEGTWAGITTEQGDKQVSMLLREDEQIKKEIRIKPFLTAPVYRGDVVGRISYYIENGAGEKILLEEYEIKTTEEILKQDYILWLHFVAESFLP